MPPFEAAKHTQQNAIMPPQREEEEQDECVSVETTSPSHTELETAQQGEKDGAALEARGQEERTHPKAAEEGEEPYSIFTAWAKWQIVILVTIAGFVSPMTANIMLPALPDIASDLHVSLESVNLSVTVFMIFQGITPLILGSLTDVVGRRPVYCE